MSGLFKVPKVPDPPPIPDQDDARTASDRLRKELAGRQGRQQSILMESRDTGAPGTRPRSNTLLGG